MAYRSSSTGTNTGTGLSAAVPAGVQTDDIVILTATQDDSAANFAAAFPAGFTLFEQDQLTVDGEKVAIAWKRTTGADSGTYTFGATGSTNRWVVQCFVFSGRHTTNNPVSSGGNVVNTGSGSPRTISATGVTAVGGDDLLWAACPDITIGTATSPVTGAPAGYTVRQDQLSGFAWLGGATKDNSGAGATGTVSGTMTWSGGGTMGYVGFLVRIPAAAAAAASLVADPRRGYRHRVERRW